VQPRHGGVTFGVGVEVEEGHILRRDFDKAGSVFDEASGEETAASEARGIILRADFGGLFIEVKSASLFRTEEPVGIVH